MTPWPIRVRRAEFVEFHCSAAIRVVMRSLLLRHALAVLTLAMTASGAFGQKVRVGQLWRRSTSLFAGQLLPGEDARRPRRWCPRCRLDDDGAVHWGRGAEPPQQRDRRLASGPGSRVSRQRGQRRPPGCS